MPTIKHGPSFPTSCRHKVPRNQVDQATHAHLSGLFRAGHIYAYAYEAGEWHVWSTQADWDATERHTPNGRTVRDPDAAARGRGPAIFDRDRLAATKAKRPTKAEAISLLRAIAEGTDWQVSDLEELLARDAA
jgi:hypothetical protein